MTDYNTKVMQSINDAVNTMTDALLKVAELCNIKCKQRGNIVKSEGLHRKIQPIWWDNESKEARSLYTPESDVFVRQILTVPALKGLLIMSMLIYRLQRCSSINTILVLGLIFGGPHWANTTLTSSVC